MKLFLNLITPFLILLSVSCGSSESSHERLASDFVEALNFDLGYDVEIIKTNTRQRNFIVVRDHDLNTLDAYDLSGYSRGDDIGAYISQNQDRFFFNLEFAFVEEQRFFIPGPIGVSQGPIFGVSTINGGFTQRVFENVYRDRDTGILFSKVAMTPSDLTKALEVLDAVRLNKATEKLTIQFGLAPKRAKEVAAYGLQVSQLDPASTTLSLIHI